MIKSIIEEWLKEKGIEYYKAIPKLGEGWWLDNYRCWILDEPPHHIVFRTSYTSYRYNLHDPDIFQKLQEKLDCICIYND